MNFITTCCQQRTKFISHLSYSLFIGFASCILLVSCKDDPSTIGLGLQESSENIYVNGIDTYSLVTSTVPIDTIKSDELSQNLLGSMYDGVFGKTQSEVYTEFRLPENNITFGASPVLDSVVLSFRYASSSPNYGNISKPQRFRVYKLNQRIYVDKTYNNKTPIAYIPTDISYSNSPKGFNLIDSFDVREGSGTVKRGAHLRLRLSDAFGNELLNAPSSTYTNDESFLNFLNGLAIIPDNPGMVAGEGGMVGLNLLSAISNITVFYNDTLQKSFVINTNCARINKYNQPVKNAQMLAQMANSGGNYDTTFVQALGVAKTKISIPNLFNILEGKNTVINYAEIVVPVVPGTVGNTYGAPPILNIFAADSVGANSPVIDYLFGSAYYGVTYNSSKGEYIFVVTRHLQQVLSNYRMHGKNLNRGFYIQIPTDGPVSASRLMLDTRKSPVRKVKLRIVYSKLD